MRERAVPKCSFWIADPERRERQQEPDMSIFDQTVSEHLSPQLMIESEAKNGAGRGFEPTYGFSGVRCGRIAFGREVLSSLVLRMESEQ